MGTLVGTKIAGEASEREAGSVPPAQRVRVVEVSVPTTVPFLPVVTSSAPMRCHLACLVVEEPQVGWPHWCHLPRFGTADLTDLAPGRCPLWCEAGAGVRACGCGCARGVRAGVQRGGGRVVTGVS